MHALPHLLYVALVSGMLTLPVVVPFFGVALLTALAARDRLAPRAAPVPAELALAYVAPVALLLWGAAGVGETATYGEGDAAAPVVLALAAQWVVVALLWRRHRRWRRFPAVVALGLSAYVTGGAWVAASMARGNPWR